MRVDQVITLVWVGNVALLGATGWVGWKFWEQKKARTQAPVVTWPTAEAKDPVAQKWPGPIRDFEHLWKTHLSGPVPPPPSPVAEVKRAPDDIRTIFKNRVSIVGGFTHSDPEASAIQLSDAQAAGGSRWMRTGESIDEWVLVGIATDEKGFIHGRFQHPADPLGVFDIASTKPQVAQVGEEGKPKPFQPTFDNTFATPWEVDPNNVPRQAYFDEKTNEWQVPFEEQVWWSKYGNEEILNKTTLVARPEGLEIASQPPRAALRDTRGITKGDILVSINDVPIRSEADLQAFFRGTGRSARRYVVVIQRDGKLRTQVYNVRRPQAH
jgi:hypothetical protein